MKFEDPIVLTSHEKMMKKKKFNNKRSGLRVSESYPDRPKKQPLRKRESIDDNIGNRQAYLKEEC